MVFSAMDTGQYKAGMFTVVRVHRTPFMMFRLRRSASPFCYGLWGLVELIRVHNCCAASTFAVSKYSRALSLWTRFGAAFHLLWGYCKEAITAGTIRDLRCNGITIAYRDATSIKMA